MRLNGAYFLIISLLIVVWIKFLLTICEFTNLAGWYFNLICSRTSKDNLLIHTLPKCIICSGICRTLEAVFSINLKLRSSLSVAEPNIKCIKSDSTVSFGFLLNKEHFKKSNYVTYYWSSRALRRPSVVLDTRMQRHTYGSSPHSARFYFLSNSNRAPKSHSSWAPCIFTITYG